LKIHLIIITYLPLNEEVNSPEKNTTKLRDNKNKQTLKSKQTQAIGDFNSSTHWAERTSVKLCQTLMVQATQHVRTE
ncbi:hypothetical protein BpHYR1_051484, partial [Brachionus plicatilis]